MMTQEENAMLTGVSPGNPLHRPLSRFWFPVLRSERLADRYTHKVRLLGEDFVVARRGKELFALDERCPHRQASLVLGRVEDGGLRCIYHGWLMDCDGTVKETPNESDVGGRPRLKVRAPGVREVGGLIWLSTCPSEAERVAFPDLPWMRLPEDNVVITDVKQKTNWVQSLEGSIDSSHTTTLHQDEIGGSEEAETSKVVSEKGAAIRFARPSSDPHPRIQVRDTDFGFIYGALRKPIRDPDAMTYVRATAFAYPSYVTFPLSSALSNLLIFVPIDNAHAHFYSIWYSKTEALDRKGRVAWSGLDPAKDLDDDGYLKLCTLPNWGQDRAAMVAGRSFSGFRGINVQDTIVQESMGPVVDRTKEHLGPADLAIVHFRQLMLAMARGEGAAAPDYAANMRYRGLIARDGLVPANQDWTKLYGEGEVNWQTPKPRRRAAG
jgi:phthalate 4,5-dioxygenase